jgi:hypothetical protein
MGLIARSAAIFSAVRFLRPALVILASGLPLLEEKRRSSDSALLIELIDPFFADGKGRPSNFAAHDGPINPAQIDRANPPNERVRPLMATRLPQ